MSKCRTVELCVYCGLQPGTTEDHVFARGFVGVSDRANFPKVPCCPRCNNVKATLEHHLTAVLPFGARHADAGRLLAVDVPRRLKQNQKLHRSLAEGLRQETFMDERGQISTRQMLPFDGTKIEALFALITRGLIYTHWGRYVESGYITRAMSMREAGQVHWERLQSHPNVTGLFGWDLGNGALRYEGFYDATNLNVTGWQFRIYGGVQLAEAGESATMIIGQSVRDDAPGATSTNI